jgi:hypothetical protein
VQQQNFQETTASVSRWVAILESELDGETKLLVARAGHFPRSMGNSDLGKTVSFIGHLSLASVVRWWIEIVPPSNFAGARGLSRFLVESTVGPTGREGDCLCCWENEFLILTPEA